jgi:DNA polymerase-1
MALAMEGYSTVFALEELNVEEQESLLYLLSSYTKKIGANLKFDIKTLSKKFAEIEPTTYFDVTIASKLLDENGDHDLETLAQKYLGTEMWKLDYKVEHTLEEWKAHCLKDTEILLPLADKMYTLLEDKNLLDLFAQEMIVQKVFTKAEIKGVPVDTEYLTSLLIKYRRHICRIEKLVFKYSGIEFNVNSTKQLADLLYNKYALPILTRTIKGEPSTDTKTLAKLTKCQTLCKIPQAVLLYRHWEMLARHIEKLLGESIDGKIYATFNTIGTETGRFSSTEPNLQQIPSKTHESRAIRKAFVGPMVVLDYSNVELRLLAHFTRDPELLKVYQPGGPGDLHQTTADKLGISRNQAKTINFGISYGMGPKKLSESINVSEDTAREMLDAWFRLYAFVNPWKRLIVNQIKKYGFVRSIGSRMRRINYSSLAMREQYSAEREAVNFVIQGSSADITKYAIARLQDEDIRMQVHDEIVIYNPKRTLEEIKQLAETVVTLKVPLVVDIKLCERWSDMKE